MNVHTLFAVLVIATALSSLALPAQAEQPRAVTRMLYRAAESSIPQVFHWTSLLLMTRARSIITMVPR